MPTSPQPSRLRLTPAQGTLLLLIGLNLLNYIDRYILPGELSLIQREFHSTDHQMGALTTALFLFYMIAAPLTGWLGDRFPRKPLIIAGAVLWSLATLATVWVHGYWTFYLRQALVGIGEATFGIFAPAVLADFYPERDRNRILSIFYVAIPVGAALGYLAGGQIGPHWGWRAPFFVCAIPGFIIAALYGLWGTEPVRGSCDRIRPTADRATAFGLLRNPAFLTATFGLATLTFAMGGISAWVPTFLERFAGLSLGRATMAVGAITVIDGIAGTLVGGWLAAHQPPRPLPAFFLERRSHPALRSPGLLRSRRLGRSRALCLRVLPLPKHRPAQRRDRQLGLRPGPRHRHRLQSFHHSLLRRHLLAPDHRRHLRPCTQPPSRPGRHSHCSGPLQHHPPRRLPLRPAAGRSLLIP
jgi:MFS family permease